MAVLGQAFQAEGTASAKALWQEAAWLEQSEWGGSCHERRLQRGAGPDQNGPVGHGKASQFD